MVFILFYFDYFTIRLLISLAQGLRVELLNSFPIKIGCLSKETPGVCNQVACFWTDYNLALLPSLTATIRLVA